VKSNNLPLSYWRFSTFSLCNFRGGARLTNSSQGCVDPTSLNMVRTVRAFISTQEVNFSVQISCCIFKREWLKVEWCENDAKFRTFDPSVKNRRGVGEISIPIVEALPTIHWNTSKYIWRQSNAWLLSAVDTKKKEKKVHGSGGLIMANAKNMAYLHASVKKTYVICTSERLTDNESRCYTLLLGWKQADIVVRNTKWWWC